MPESSSDLGPLRILPVGTQVVLGDATGRAGAVGVILRAPVDHLHAYRIRLVDGEVVHCRRRDLSILKHFKRDRLDGSGSSPSDFELESRVIYRCVVGSRAFGLDTEESDSDRRGIFVPPAELHWSIFGVPEQVEFPDSEECYWEIRKFLILALKANPNVLECLYTPLVEKATPLAQELLALRSIFLSRLVYQTYNGYVLSQFKKLEAGLRNRGAIKWKLAMHLIRLLLSGISILRAGAVIVRVDEERDRLLAIRRGETPFAEVERWRRALQREFEAAFATTSLPERPDYERANALLLRARRQAAGGSTA